MSRAPIPAGNAGASTTIPMLSRSTPLIPMDPEDRPFIDRPVTRSELCTTTSRTRDQCIQCCAVNQDGASWSDGACVAACNQFVWDPRFDPTRNPRDWGEGGCHGACYRYATCSPVDRPQTDRRLWGPAMTEPPGLPRHNCTCAGMIAALKAAGAVDALSGGKCPPNSYGIWALVQSPLTQKPGEYCDFHFYRQGPDGWWSERNGCHPGSIRVFPDPAQEAIRDSGSHDLSCGMLC